MAKSNTLLYIGSATMPCCSLKTRSHHFLALNANPSRHQSKPFPLPDQGALNTQCPCIAKAALWQASISVNHRELPWQSFMPSEPTKDCRTSTALRREAHWRYASSHPEAGSRPAKIPPLNRRRHSAMFQPQGTGCT